MDKIERRARELLAAEWESRGAWVEASFIRGPMYAGDPVLCAIIAALTPPEGFVLVKAETLQDLASDAEEYVRTTEFRQSHIEDKLQSVRETQDLLTAFSAANAKPEGRSFCGRKGCCGEES